ncbi:hypothetical protein TWF730_006318 [Orbilia blumenaviensis]|uniref:Mus7/MMS22 family-domain-containing protein n=1 Tax=Orbilia blumenaviensis TaxID=1796055 RepID=A0AAV9VFH5_9PEZI
MNDWRSLGYVPDSEGEDDCDILLSPPRIVEETTVADSRHSHDITNEGTNGERNLDGLDIFDLPTSSVENGEHSRAQTRRRGRPPKRGRGVKRLSVGGDQRPKKQPRIGEHPVEVVDLASTPSTPKQPISDGGMGGIPSSYPSSGKKTLLNLFSAKDDGDTTFDTNLGGISPGQVDISTLEPLVSKPHIDPAQTDEDVIEEVDLIDEHGPDSDMEDAPAQLPIPAVIPPSSPPVPPRILSIESIFNSPALPSRVIPVESGANSPAPPTPASISSNLEVRIPLFSHTGLTDPATRINLDSAATNSDEPVVPPDDFTSGVARNLRTRKPIQMNPYQIEAERYNSDWKSRGLKPIRYVYNEPILLSNKKVAEKDSQEDEWAIPEGEDEETQPATLQQTQSFQSVDQDSMDIEGGRALDDDEELLALDKLFERSTKERPPRPGAQTTGKGGKRRKTSHPLGLSAKSRRIIESAKATLARGSNLSVVPEEAVRLQHGDVGPIDIQRTPVIESKKSRDRFDIFDLGSSGSDSDSLNENPPVSTSRRQVILDSDDSDGGDTTPRAGSPIRRNFPVLSPSEPEEEDEEESPNDPEAREQEIQRYQRKVRGVLPASWIRFNQAGDQENKKPGNMHHSPEARPVVKGLAQMRIRARNSPPPGSMANPLNLSSPETSEDDAHEVQIVEEHTTVPSIASPARLPAPALMKPSAFFERSYAFEDRSFDRMLSRPRAANSGTKGKIKSSKSRKLQQSKLPKASFQTYNNSGSKRTFSHSTPRQKSVALSVVDACKRYRKTKGTSPPSFMRLAERLAKKRENFGRHLPDHKVVQIDQVSEDETDAEDTLIRWKKTKVKESSSFHFTNPPTSAGPHQPRANFSRTTSIAGRQTTYLQTNLQSYRLRREPGLQNSKKPRLKSHVIAKPIAMIPPPIHKRRKCMDDIIEGLRSKQPSENHIENTPKVRDLELTLPQSRLLAPAQALNNGNSMAPQTSRRKSRKTNMPRRIERNKSPSPFQPPERQLADLPESMEIDASGGETLLFEGMGAAGTVYSISFDIEVPRNRTLFHGSTFIGNGSFARALQTSSGRTYRSTTGLQGVEVMENILEWGVYEEAVAEQLESNLDSVLSRVEALLGCKDLSTLGFTTAVLEMRKFFQYVVDYLSTGVFFSDLIDIGSFAVRLLDILSEFISKARSLRIVFGEGTNVSAQEKPEGGSTANDQVALEKLRIFQTQIYAFTSVWLRQLSCIADKYIPAPDEIKLQDFCNEVSKSLISVLTSWRPHKLQSGFSGSFQSISSASHLNEEAVCLESWIIAFHTSPPMNPSGPLRKPSFWEHVNTSICLKPVRILTSVATLDALWREIFRLLPLLAIDAEGRVSPFQHKDPVPDNWGLVKELMVQSLTIYNSSALLGRINALRYIKTLFTRCLVFLRDWNWGHPEIIIIALYDSFGKRLANLTGEKDPKAPDFLEHLDSPAFSSESSETCFSTFLKIVALGIKQMRSQESKGLGDLVIRIIPNRGRVFLKENSFDMLEFDILANHHYLLTALCYGATHDIRKRVAGIVRQLVDPGQSHSRVCALNLRAWANILICELAEGKRRDILEELMKWHAGIVQTSARLHKENDTKLEEEKKKTSDPTRIAGLEGLAIRNKESVESVLASAMDLLKMVFKKDICDFYSAEFVLGVDSLKTIWAMAGSLPQSLVANAVQILSYHIKVCQDFEFSSSTKDDSQGSWAGFEGIESEGVRKEAAKKLLDEIHDPLLALINAYFAGRGKNLDNVLGPCTQVWVELGSLLVKCGLKTWDDYFNPYQKSWFSMIDTDTKKAYSVAYVTNIIKIDPGVYDTHRTQILELWAQSLVERDSLLKFQHELTAVLFNLDLTNSLFSNMPFVVNQDIEQYEISAKDFKERRLSLIGTLLENIQKEMVRVSDAGDQSKARIAKSEYISILQELMKTMKLNYMAIHAVQNTGQNACQNTGNKTADTNKVEIWITDSAANSYVGFCQRVVEYLQQYTTDICAIDKFFVDSVIFPLPKSDPTYVTSKLKGYFIRLEAERRGWFIQFLQFWQNTVGRVAVEKQQEYFIEQILGAFDVGERQIIEQGRGGRTLREFCVIAMFGTYLERCMEGMANLVVAVPVLGVVEQVVKGLVLEFDGVEEEKQVDRRISGLLVAVLEAVGLAVERAINLKEKVFTEPLAMCVVEALVKIVEACDPMVNLLHPKAQHVSEELPQDLLKIAVRGLSRLKACLMARELPEKLDLVMFERDLPFQTEKKRFNSEYVTEMGKWKIEGRELFVKRAAVKKKVEWDHLVPQLSVVEGRARLAKKIEDVLQLAGSGVCGVVVRGAGEKVVESRPRCKWGNELLGIQEREAGFDAEYEPFDMDD